jgi:hypothetical protein
METSPIHSASDLSEGTHSFNTSYSGRPDDEMRLLRAKYKQSNNKVYHDFFKTKVCSLYNLNICKKGKDCPFAHSLDELRDKPNLYKTKLCDAFLQGQCNKGEDCNFAHGEEELRSTPDLFKTAICNLWTQGKCTAGETCRFAHGYDDLRPAPSHHKFKKKSFNKSQQQQTPSYHHQSQNMYYNNQYAYPPSVYAYPMYPMPMMPGDMQHAYMMNQPFGFNGGMGPSMRPQ